MLRHPPSNTGSSTPTCSPLPRWETFEFEFDGPSTESGVVLPDPTNYTLTFEVGWSADPEHNRCIYIDQVDVQQVWSGWNVTLAGLCPRTCGKCAATLNDTGLWVPPTCTAGEVQCDTHTVDVDVDHNVPSCAAQYGQCGGEGYAGILDLGLILTIYNVAARKSFRVLCSTSVFTCVLGADWCLRSDVMPDPPSVTVTVL